MALKDGTLESAGGPRVTVMLDLWRPGDNQED
jgi:hypothetical protein